MFTVFKKKEKKLFKKNNRYCSSVQRSTSFQSSPSLICLAPGYSCQSIHTLLIRNICYERGVPRQIIIHHPFINTLSSQRQFLGFRQSKTRTSIPTGDCVKLLVITNKTKSTYYFCKKQHTNQPTFSPPKATEESLPVGHTEMNSHRFDLFKCLYCLLKRNVIISGRCSTPTVQLSGASFFLMTNSVHLIRVICFWSD